GLGEGDRDRPVDPAGIDRCDQRIAAAENILLRNGAIEHDAVRARIADTCGQAARGFLDHGHFNCRLVGRAGYRRRLDVDLLEITETLDAHLGSLDAGTVVPRILELAYFASDHFVAGPGVAADIDLANIHATTGI